MHAILKDVGMEIMPLSDKLSLAMAAGKEIIIFSDEQQHNYTDQSIIQLTINDSIQKKQKKTAQWKQNPLTRF